MRPEPSSAWRHGDVVHHKDNIGVVQLLERKGDNQPYLKVRIVKGPLLQVTSWDWPEGWRPQLDVGENPTLPCTCAECGREFKAPRADEVFCRTCDEQGLKERTEAEVGCFERLRSRLRRSDR